MIAVFCAMQQELNCLKKSVRITGPEVNKAFQIFHGTCGEAEILLVLTGVGKNCALNAAEYVFGNYRINQVISTGFCGSLDGNAKAGDLAVYSEIKCDVSPYDKQKYYGIECNVIDSTEYLKYGLLIGNGITVPSACTTPDLKRKLARKSGCRFVDMESYWIGTVAKSHNVPCIVIRPVFDTLTDDVSPITELAPNNKFSYSKSVVYLLLHPEKISLMIRYARAYLTIRKNLSSFVKEYIESGAFPGVN